MLTRASPPTPTQVLPSQLVNDEEGKVLRVRMIQKEGKKLFDPVYLFDEGSTVSWIPCGRKLTCSFPGTCCASWLTDEKLSCAVLCCAFRCRTCLCSVHMLQIRL